jgi:AraC-like DNA-binding protein/Tfp pilus assembly protein PilF
MFGSPILKNEPIGMSRKLRHVNIKLLLGVTALTLSLTFCTSKKSVDRLTEQFLASSSRAKAMLVTDPKAAIAALDSAYNLTGGKDLPDTLVTVYLNLKAEALLQLDSKDSAILFMQTFVSATPIEKNKSSRKNALLWLIKYSINDGKYTDTRKHLNEIYSMMANDTGSFEFARALNLEGGFLSRTGDYVGAQKKMLAAAKHFENLNNSRALGAVYSGIATNYQSLGESGLAMLYFRKALSITQQNKDSLNWFLALNSLGNIFQQSNPDSAKYYFFKARDLMSLKQWSNESLSVQYNLAMFYYNRKEYPKAMDIYRKILALCRQYNIKSGIYRAMSGIGNVFEAQNKDIEALQTFHEAAQLADEAGEKPVQVQLLEGAKYMYEKAGNYKDAYITQKKIKHLSDSLFTLDKQIAVHNLEIAYNKEKTERQNEALNNKMLLMKGKMKASYIILGLVLLSALVLGWQLYHIYKLYQQRNIAYNTLFEKYRIDMQSVGTDTNKIPELKLIPAVAPEESNLPYRKFIAYFESEKPFLNPALRFDNVALHLRINRKILSHQLQQNTGMNFNTFVNSYRIKETLRLLAEPNLQQYKIEAIAKEAGFGSKASFYAAFSQVTGSKPSDFREGI